MRLIAFDLDGTLVDSRKDIASSANAALEAVGLPRKAEDEVARYVGHGARNLVARCVEPRLDLLEEALAAWHAHYREHLLDTTLPYPGIAEVLRELSAVAVLAVATNKPGAYARTICEAFFPGVFAKVIGGDEAPRKPDPTMVHGLCETLGVRTSDTIYVGDMLVDLQTAEAAGVSFVGVGWGFGAEPPAERHARDTAELLSLLR